MAGRGACPTSLRHPAERVAASQGTWEEEACTKPPVDSFLGAETGLSPWRNRLSLASCQPSTANAQGSFFPGGSIWEEKSAPGLCVMCAGREGGLPPPARRTRPQYHFPFQDQEREVLNFKSTQLGAWKRVRVGGQHQWMNSGRLLLALPPPAQPLHPGDWMPSACLCNWSVWCVFLGLITSGPF